jgi:hypothetical protein
MYAAVVAIVLLFQWWRQGSLSLHGDTWLRIGAAMLALVAALGRGGWSIQTYKGATIPERIDRGMYMVEQLGAAAILIFVLTL